jgi:hypothetical protein
MNSAEMQNRMHKRKSNIISQGIRRGRNQMFYRDDLLRAAAGAQKKKNVDIAIGTGLNRGTVSRVMDGDPNAAYLTVWKVADFLGFSEVPTTGAAAINEAIDAAALAQSLPKEKIA